MIAQMYTKDTTTITLGNLQETIEVTSGIRQGCSISTLLFKMLTFSIIEKLTNKWVQYKVDKYEGNSLWLADDVTLIASSIKDMTQNIEVLKELAREIGLEINEKKSKVLQIRGTQKLEDICGLEVKD